MKNFKKFLFLCAACISAAMSLASPVFAEGSRDLIEIPYGTHTGMDAYRPYLEWRNREQLGGIPSKNVIYVYAKAGEKVYFGSSVKSANDKSIKAVVGDNASQEISSNLQGSTIAVTLPTDAKEGVYDPTGKADAVFVDGSTISSGNYDSKNVYLFKPDLSTQKGLIVNLEQEKNGPRGVNDSSVDQSKGYKPMSFTAPVTGTYSFRFLSTEYAETDVPDSSVDFTDGEILDINFDSLDVSDEQQINKTYTFKDDKVSILLTLKGVPDERYFQIAENNTNYWKDYQNYLDAHKTGENVNIQFTPPKSPAMVEVLWSFDETSGSDSMKFHIDQNGEELTHENHPTSDTERNYSTTAYITDTSNPIKIYAEAYPINIYAIKYTYLDDTTTPPSTGGDSVTYNFNDGIPTGITSSKQDTTDTDIQHDIYKKAIELDPIREDDDFDKETGYPDNRYIAFTPTSNGSVTVDAYATKEQGSIYITQAPGIPATASGTLEEINLTTTKAVPVEAGKTIYIYLQM